MFEKLLKLLPGARSESSDAGDDALAPPDVLTPANAPPFEFTPALRMVDGLPMADWKLVYQWLDGIADPKTRGIAWSHATLGWIAHLQRALGSSYHVVQHEYSLVLSTLSPGSARRTAELVSDRYQAGAATQLDVTQAQRDAFLADVSRIQADAELACARASLRGAADLPLEEQSQ